MPREPQKDDLSLAFDGRIKEQVAIMPTNPMSTTVLPVMPVKNDPGHQLCSHPENVPQ